MKSHKTVIVLMTKKKRFLKNKEIRGIVKVSTRTEGNTSVKSNELERDLSNYELVMTENEEFKKKVEDLQKQNTKYKEEIEFFEKCKTKGKKIMEKYMKQKEINECSQKKNHMKLLKK